MALIDEQFIRNTFNVHRDVVSTRITAYISAASRRLKKTVGDAIYSSPDTDVQNVLKIAEGTLLMHLLQLNVNTNIRPKGVVLMESVEGNVTVKYLTPAETIQNAQHFLDQYEELIREFLGEDQVDLTSVIDDSEGVWQT